MNVQFQTFVTRKLDVLTQSSHLHVNAMLDILGMVRNAKVMVFLSSSNSSQHLYFNILQS